MHKLLLGISLITSLTLSIGAQITQAPIRLSEQQTLSIKDIITKQEILSKEFQILEQQKLILIQRIALEHKLSAEQLDKLELSIVGNEFVLQSKSASTPDK